MTNDQSRPMMMVFPGEVNLLIWLNGQCTTISLEQFERLAESVTQAVEAGGQTISIDFGTSPITFVYLKDPIEALVTPVLERKVD